MAEQLQIHYVDLGVPRVTDLKSDMSVGRTEGNDLVLNHPSVSRKHARFESRNHQWFIIDLKSTNGVKVNGNLITEAQVSPG
ncbi:MAG: FHA domain-containing protein, partial [Acidobacteria bacterium]|nr:FHA domain-containing protein [Acidobacteriota bacterium]